MISEWTDHHQQALDDYQQWIAVYEQAHKTHASCKFLKHVGNPKVDTRLEPLIELHDRITQAKEDKPLA